MDATDRIIVEFDRLVALGSDARAARPLVERIVFFVVATRCEIDINGFDSVYDQLLKPAELSILIEGLHKIGESGLAGEFEKGYDLLIVDGFYKHMNWNNVSAAVKGEIDSIGDRVSDRLWHLDEKLTMLLDNEDGSTA